MIMNTNIVSIVRMGCCCAMAFAACQSPEQKADAAFERVKAEKMLSNDSILVDKALAEEPKKTEVVKTTIEYIDKWAKFKLEIEKKIVANDNAIKAIKNSPNANAKLLKKATSLEENNNDLRRQLDVYNQEETLRWETFKAMMDHDVNEIGIALKNLTINDK